MGRGTKKCAKNTHLYFKYWDFVLQSNFKDLRTFSFLKNIISIGKHGRKFLAWPNASEISCLRIGRAYHVEHSLEGVRIRWCKHRDVLAFLRDFHGFFMFFGDFCVLFTDFSQIFTTYPFNSFFKVSMLTLLNMALQGLFLLRCFIKLCLCCTEYPHRLQT